MQILIENDKRFLDSITELPGCYIFKSSDNKILYVGKAINLRKRLKQYFDLSLGINASLKIEPKKQIMISQARYIDLITTDSEIEALILETNLIKKHKPKYNTLMVDDKSYSYIKITINEDFPRIKYVRERKNDKSLYFGPFPSAFPARETIKRLRKYFPYRTCNRTLIQIKTGNQTYVKASDPKPCLYYHLKLCDAPCASYTTKQEYRKNINKIIFYLRGEKETLIKSLEKEMFALSSAEKFEEASLIRDQIENLKYITQRININEKFDEKLWQDYKEQREKTSLENLKNELLKRNIIDLHNQLNRIECYDISNIQGKAAVGSMVVATNGQINKSQYRKFKIKIKDTPDDFTMMKEVLERRFRQRDKNNLDESFSKMPDLIIVDGGKGQLSSALDVLTQYEMNIPIIGLAKREEIIIWMDGLTFRSYKLKDKSEEKFLMQRIRDEAHRFAISYHRKLRSRNQEVSKLDSIPGIGPKTKRNLLIKYKSVTNIKRAGRKSLMEVVRNRRTVENILKYL